MLPATNKGAGSNMGFPDVCLTPAAPSPIPVPYPNIGMHAMAAPFCPTIFLSMLPALNMASTIPMTMGDEPGVANPLFKQLGTFTMGNPKVFLQGMPAITLTCPTTGNAMNNAVGTVAVPSVTNVFFTCAVGARDDRRARTHSELVAMADDIGRGGLVSASLRADRLVVARVRAFGRGVATELHAEVARLCPGRPASLILDLRGCPGGDLEAAVELAAEMLPEGTIVARVRDTDDDEVVRRAHGDAWGCPLVLLVDRSTASAAEVFAGALQASGRATVLGERTFGKGIVQALSAGAEGAAVAATVGRVLLPDGRGLQGRGVQPDGPLPPLFGEELVADRA